ncbi:hypothetical protein BB559_005934 [Furculomyces boomerangus]|uniref:Uncharacterized protein n=1 Tax=Furculomyces boomerangus TaxID=61424 RepID=A0A2T9Y5R7_9FUNG|nr:hypothetical protein BB559_005934 [Furculomyces boomerangus]
MNTLTNDNKSLESSVVNEPPPKLPNSILKKFDKRITFPLLLIYTVMGFGDSVAHFDENFVVQLCISFGYLKTTVLLAILLAGVPFFKFFVRSEPKWVISIATFAYGVSSIIYPFQSQPAIQFTLTSIKSVSYSFFHYMGMLYLTLWFPKSKLYSRIVLIFIFLCIPGALGMSKVKYSPLKFYNQTLSDITNYVCGSLTIIAGILSFFMLEGYPDEAKFLTEKERKNTAKLLSFDRGNSIETSIDDQTKQHCLYSILSHYASLIAGVLLLFFRRPTERFIVILNILFKFALVFTITTILLSGLTKLYVPTVITGLVSYLLFDAIRMHVFVSLFTLTNNPNKKMFLVTSFVVFCGIPVFLLYSWYTFEGFGVSDQTYGNFHRAYEIVVIFVAIPLSYFAAKATVGPSNGHKKYL